MVISTHHPHNPLILQEANTTVTAVVRTGRSVHAADGTVRIPQRLETVLVLLRIVFRRPNDSRIAERSVEIAHDCDRVRYHQKPSKFGRGKALKDEANEKRSEEEENGERNGYLPKCDSDKAKAPVRSHSNPLSALLRRIHQNEELAFVEAKPACHYT